LGTVIRSTTPVQPTGLAGATAIAAGSRHSLARVPANTPPVAADDSYVTDEDTPLAVPAPGVLANDTDADGDPLQATLVSGPTRGQLALDASGAFVYAPAANDFGIVTFTYKVSDGSAESNVATVAILVRPVNDLPV